MKRINKMMAAMAAVAILALLPNTNTFPVKAAEPVTYAVKYVSEEQGWRYQPNTSTYDDSAGGGPITLLQTYLNDGDLVVVYNDLGTGTALDLGSVKLSNLTYAQNTKTSLVFAGAVQDCYVLGGSTGTVNCDVTNAYVYDTVTFNFNGNVGTLNLYTAGDALSSNIGTVGTVGHLYATSTTSQRVFFDLYDFAAGTLYFQDGAFVPKNTNFKNAEEHAAEAPEATEAPAVTETPTAPSTDTAAPSTNATTTDPSDEYDDVPKTGQSYLYLWLLLASAACFAGSLALRRTDK